MIEINFAPQWTPAAIAPAVDHRDPVFQQQTGLCRDEFAPHQHRHFGAQFTPVELDRFLAAAFEEQTRLDQQQQQVSERLLDMVEKGLERS